MTFVQGIDYGPRKGTLGIGLHMSEGGDGLATYLGRKSGETNYQWRTRVRGVSCNVAILSTGERIQMLKWGSTSGNLNPYDRSTDKAFYGRRFLLAVLGDKWPDPNSYTISAELAGKRAVGPTRAQVESTVEWVGEMRTLYPEMRGAIGHADQTDTKSCPGTAPTMLEIWHRIGHGLFPVNTTEEVPMIQTQFVGRSIGLATTIRATSAIDVETGTARPVAAGYGRNVIAESALQVQLSPSLGPGELMLEVTYGEPDRRELIRASDTDWPAGIAAPVPDMTPYDTEALDAARLAGRQEEWDRQRVAATATVNLAPRPGP